ncbi:MAG: twin-arginine translocase subunit TatC [Planctomycetes bacterium]|nr:twin-arginine translocase subunit TatC [Planctomycetota bacterium]
MEEKRLSLGGHLEELRVRLIWSAVAFAVALAICFIFQDQILKIIIAPHLKASNGKALSTLTYPEGFFIYFKASLIAAFVVSGPFIIYQLWKFISAGLYSHEKGYVFFYLPFSLLLFAGGVIFSYFILIPMMLKFLIVYPNPLLIENIYNLTCYFDLFIMFTVIMGLVFQLPLLMLFLVQIKILTPQIYWGKIKISILLAFIISAIITPSGDPINQTLIAAPLLVLYLIGILLSWMYLRINKPKEVT